MTDEFDELLRREACRHNVPPERVPLEEMWDGIVARRRERAEQQRRRYGLILRWGVAAAAVLVVGIAIGRVTAGRRGPAVASGNDDPAVAAVAAENYRYAAAEHLDRAEVLLTLFLFDARQGSPAASASTEARELLSMNRLLQGSPASRDPELKALLDELELLLMEIALVAEQRGPGGLELVVRGLRENGTLARLRAASAPQRLVRLPGKEL